MLHGSQGEGNAAGNRYGYSSDNRYVWQVTYSLLKDNKQLYIFEIFGAPLSEIGPLYTN